MTPPPASGAGWGALLALAREARNQPPDPREAVTCPNDGTLLLAGPRGGPRCPFDGYRRQ